MIKIFLLASIVSSAMVVSFYTLSVPAINPNNTIRLKNYQNKKILIVNTATGSSSAGQLLQLQQLYLQHKDSMVIIAFPSNSFGNEPRNKNRLKKYMRDTLGLTFPIAEKSSVKGENCNDVFEWLRRKVNNDAANARCKSDFQKYFIDKRGQLVGVFDSSVSPLSTLMQNTIKNN
jgi:glutathione peroxidase